MFKIYAKDICVEAGCEQHICRTRSLWFNEKNFACEAPNFLLCSDTCAKMGGMFSKAIRQPVTFTFK